MCTSFTMIPSNPSLVQHKAAAVIPSVNTVSPLTTSSVADIIYTATNLQAYGLSKEAFDLAWKGYQFLLSNHTITKSTYLTICDFSQSSKQKRLYIIDVENRQLVTHTYVAHGKNSGGEYATRFSNINESLQSSLGFYVTSNTYMGKHGLSLKLQGVDPGYNDNAMQRTIVIHGAPYVDAARLKAGMYMGRSWGCPAVPQKESAGIIQTIKNGTCLFIYHPTKTYLVNSKILNG